MISKNYEDEEYNFKLKYPNGWIVEKNPVGKNIYLYFYPENKNIDIEMFISVEEAEINEDFRNYSETNFENYKKSLVDNFVNEDALTMLGNPIIISKVLKPNENDISVLTTYDFPDSEVKMSMLSSVRNGIFYSMLIKTTYEGEEKYSEEISDVLNSFCYKDNVPPPQKNSSVGGYQIGWLIGKVLWLIIIISIVFLFFEKKSKKKDSDDSVEADAYYDDKEEERKNKKKRKLKMSKKMY